MRFVKKIYFGKELNFNPSVLGCDRSWCYTSLLLTKTILFLALQVMTRSLMVIAMTPSLGANCEVVSMASVVICILLVLLVTEIPAGDWERSN
ncbi:hypothetical protein [Nostoc sp.]|uniref:hypothetical protein n=1 Tax=Nostoc sp. TaxID=1180 RepID=UPI002FFA39BB